MEVQHDLNAVFDDIWNELIRAVHKRNHPWKQPVVANAINATAQQRMVVLRRSEKEFYRLFFHTDSRSAKFRQLQETPLLSWLFWHPKKRIQVRMQSEVHLHHLNSLSEQEWYRTSPGSLKVYAQVLPPAHNLNCPTPPQALEPDAHYTHEDLDAGRPFFVVVEANIKSIDWLHLSSPQQRAFFERLPVVTTGQIEWSQNWSTP